MKEDFEDLAWALTSEPFDAQQLVDKHKEELASIVEELSEVKATEKSAEKIEELRSEITKKVRSEFTLEEGTRLFRSSPFISETVELDGIVFDGASFIAHKVKKDPAYDEKHLELNPYNEHWQLEYKTRGPKFISAVKVTGCLIVAASGPGICYAYLIIIKGRASPLIFFNGDLSDSRIISALQLEDTSLDTKYVAEAFRRSLLLCSAVYFYSPPKHSGWCWTPNGDRIFCSTVYDNLMFKGLYKEKGLRNVYEDIVLDRTERTYSEISSDYHSMLPDTLPVKIGTTISTLSRLLPQFQEEGLVQDRLWVFESADDATAKSMATITVNRHYSSTETLFSSMRLPYIEEQAKRYVDCVAIIRHDCTICSMHDFNKILKYLYELLHNGNGNDDLKRIVPVLVIDRAGSIPDGIELHQLSLTEQRKIENLEKVQKVVGELDCNIVKFAERNPDALKQRMKKAIANAREMIKTLPMRSQSSSAVIFIATALLLREGGLFTDSDVQDMLQWLRNEVKERTSMSRSVCKAIGDVTSDAVCTGRLEIGLEEGPPYWNHEKALISRDDSFCLTRNVFIEEILANSDVPVGINKAMEALEAEGVLIPYPNSKDNQKIWRVQIEGGYKKKPKRFYTFSREWLSPEANNIIDEYVASDVFHRIEEAIELFFPYIKHRRLDMACGQFIKEYNTINPFVAVCGSPGSGKTDLLMMQALQRATADDVVIILDPTNSYCEYEWSQHKVPKKIVDERVLFWDMSVKGFPIDLLDFSNCTNVYQKRERLFSMLLSGSHLSGCDQLSILMTAVEIMVDKIEKGEKNMYNLIVGSFGEKKDEIKVMNRVLSVFSTIATNNETPPGWDKLLAERGKILIISTGNATVKVDCNPLDMVADHFYSYKDAHRAGNVSLILDEIQTMNLDIGAPIDILLSNGRKVNIAAFLASQRYSNVNDNLGRVFDYCGTKIFFSPMESCIEAVSEKTHITVERLRGFEQGECAFIGPAYSEHKGKNIPIRSALIGVTYRPPYVGSYV